MKVIENELDKSFGPSASYAGLLFFFTGIFVTTLSISGILLVLIGAVIGFSRSGIIIEKENSRLKYYTKIFWIFKQGKWQNLSDYNELILLKNRKVYTTYSRSNRINQTKESGYIIYLLKSTNKHKIPVKICSSIEEGKSEIRNISEILELSL